MRHGSVWLIGVALAGTVGCGDGGGGPSGGDDEGARLATQFEDLADSVDGAGFSPTAAALRHAAEIVRLTGHATPVTLSIDGASRSFLAVAEQLDFPQLQCTWPTDTGSTPPGEPPDGSPPPVPPTDSSLVDPATGAAVSADSTMDPPRPPGECTEVGTFSMRTLIAWEPERMAEVVRLVADAGSNGVDTTVPDVMTGLPTNASPNGEAPPRNDPMPGDTMGGGGNGGGNGGGGTGGGGNGGFPGFMGEYLVGDEGMWFAVEGTQANDLARSGGACTAERARFDWAEFSCEQASFSYEFRMRVEPLRFVGTPRPGGGPEPETGMPPNGGDPQGGPEGEHAIAMTRSAVDGVRLSVVAWAPPPVPVSPPDDNPPGRPVPPDSAVVDPSGGTP